MNRRQKKKREQQHLLNMVMLAKDMLAAGEKCSREYDPVVNTARILAGRRKKCSISKWVLRKR